MAAINKIYPATQAIRQSLLPFKSQFDLNNSFRPGQAIDPVLAVFDFLAGIHGKEEFISNPPSRGNGSNPINSWPYTTVLGRNVASPYFVNRASRQFEVGSVLATTDDEWIELQGAIYAAYLLLDPISLLGYLEPVWQQFWLESLGLFMYEGPLKGADNTVLPVPPTTDPIVFADQWNTVKVPYDKGIGVDTEYVAGVVTSTALEPDQFYLRNIGFINLNNQAMVDYWNYIWPSVVSR